MQLWLWLLLGALAVLAVVAAVVALRHEDDQAAPPAVDAVVDALDEPAVSAPGQDRTAPADTELSAPVAASDAHPLPDVLVDPAVLIEKGARRLTVFSAGEPVKVYRIALGREPRGDKEREGDLRTPEGEFYVCTRNESSNHHRALGLSYPNAEDADRGLSEGLISKREHRAILDAVRHMTRPPWKTALGGEIMIHGGGTETDWTEGCIALADGEAEELFRALPLGAPVRIAE